MSLWTPGGEHPVDRGRPTDTPPSQADSDVSNAPDIMSLLTDEQKAEFQKMSPEEQEQARQMVAQMAESRQRMLETPAGMIVANHAMGLYELAAIHLQAEPPQVSESKVAIDALAGLLNGAGDNLGPDGQTLRDALAQIQMAYVQIRAAMEQGQGQPGQDQREPEATPPDQG